MRSLPVFLALFLVPLLCFAETQDVSKTSNGFLRSSNRYEISEAQGLESWRIEVSKKFVRLPSLKQASYIEQVCARLERDAQKQDRTVYTCGFSYNGQEFATWVDPGDGNEHARFAAWYVSALSFLRN